MAVDRAAGEPAHLLELLDARDRPRRERGEHDVVGDEVGTDVGARRAPLAPRGQLAQHRQLARAEALPALHRPVALVVGHVGEAARVLEGAQLLLDPPHAPALLQVGAQPVVQGQEVHDVLARVDELLGPERAARPVGVGLILLDADLQHALEEHGEPDLEAVAQEGGHHLRVDHAPHRGAHERGEDLQVLAAAVQDDGYLGVAEQRDER